MSAKVFLAFFMRLFVFQAIEVPEIESSSMLKPRGCYRVKFLVKLLPVLAPICPCFECILLLRPMPPAVFGAFPAGLKFFVVLDLIELRVTEVF